MPADLTDEGSLLASAGFKGGIHPPDRKDATREAAIERIPFPQRVVVPMSQHLGAPCAPEVGLGERVARGQRIGFVDALISAPVHAPLTGEVTAIRDQLLASGHVVTAVEIEADASADQVGVMPVERTASIPDTVRAAGIVGLGGAAFPSSVKLTPPKDAPIKTVILNGCECEPYLTCDHRLMLEHPDRVMAGARIIRDAVGADRVVVGIEDNKADAIDAMRAASGEDVEVLSLPTNYPQGAEKQLIVAVMGAEVPHGKLPAATGALVHNVGTAAAIADAVEHGTPLVERVVTVTGNVARPGNYLVPLGTSFSALLEHAGGFHGEVGRVVAGGPMTGAAVSDLSVPVVKGTSGVVVLDADVVAPAVHGDQPCIRCGRCSEACPMFLQPFAIGIYANRADWEGTERYHALDCIECGCCSYICPTRRPLVQLIRLAKHAQLARGR